MKEGLFTTDIIFITEIQCNIASLPNLSNSEVAEVLSEEYRGAAVYRCTDGYEVNGYPLVYCNETAQWSQLEATCGEVVEGLSTIQHSTATLMSTPEDMTTTVSSRMTSALMSTPDDMTTTVSSRMTSALMSTPDDMTTAMSSRSTSAAASTIQMTSEGTGEDEEQTEDNDTILIIGKRVVGRVTYVAHVRVIIVETLLWFRNTFYSAFYICLCCI